MKISVTGHTSGIGLALFNTFKEHDHDVIGFSKRTGFDIGDEHIRKLIVEQSQDCDIFINNAFHPTGQEQLLVEMLQSWEGKSKIIINLSSMIIKYCDGPLFQGEVKVYKDSKTSLNKTVVNYKGAVRILNILPGMVNTSFYLIELSNDPAVKQKFKEGIDPVQLSKLIFDVLKYKDNLKILNLEVDNVL
jgi:NADP-dependent 3-hydroxy acid dehydrogenase YdfG